MLSFAGNGVGCGLVGFDVDQPVDSIFGSVNDLAVSMLLESARQVGRYSDV